MEERISMLAIIRGAGDIASAIALRLHKCGASVIMTEVEHPLTVRRTVAFSEAIHSGKTQVEGVVGVRVESVDDALRRTLEGVVPVLVDPKCSCIWLEPDVLVDAILAKRNVGTTIGMAPIVIGVGPGFTAGDDCHAVVETMRGHTLGRVYYEGSALPNTAVPGACRRLRRRARAARAKRWHLPRSRFNSRPRRGGTGRRIRGRRPCYCHPHRHATRPACWRNACYQRLGSAAISIRATKRATAKRYRTKPGSRRRRAGSHSSFERHAHESIGGIKHANDWQNTSRVPRARHAIWCWLP